MPAAPLTPEEIEVIREITRQTSISYVGSLCAALTEPQITRMRSHIGRWELVANKFTKLGGNGLDVDYERNRAGIREKVCDMLGVPVPKADDEFELPGTQSVQIRSGW